MKYGPNSRSLSARLWQRTQRLGPEDCWLWTGAKTTEGYGSMVFKNKGQYPHRVAYEMLVGPIPPGMTLDHYRLNPGPRRAPCSRACLNPAHLEPATSRENALRGNGRSAENARKSLCPRGHPYDGTGRRGDGRIVRHCKRCRNARARAARRPANENLPMGARS